MNKLKMRYAAAGFGLALAMIAAAPSAHAQSASKWNKRGQAAEARDNYDEAFEDFRQAHLKKPGDLRYKARFERLRFEAANQHLDRGRVLRQSGDNAAAMVEFQRALQIDPSNEAAAQELNMVAKPAIPTGGAGVAPSANGAPLTASGAVLGTPGAALEPLDNEQIPHQVQVQRDIASMSSPIALKAVSDDPITLHMVEDTKIIYQAIGKAAGLNVIFDPDYTSKRIPVDLTGVSLADALRIVGTLAGTFWKPVTSNTIFVAQNNRTKRTDLDDLAVQTFYLTNVSQQNDANEVLVALRNLLDPSIKIYLVASQNAIVMRASPDQLVLAEKLINDLDRARAEVVIDVAVLEVSRQKERNLGITLPTSIGLTPQYSNANVSTSTSTTTTTSTTAGFTLNTLANLNATNFAVTLSGGTVNALLSDADTRILQNPRIRATDGQRSTLKIGSKIPVATGSYSSTLSTTTSLGVQTQFTYLDVGVNIDITPTVHYDREISLKLKVEISSQNGSSTISGVTEPIIAQRVSEQVIQLKDGEPSLLAGLFQQQDTNSISGTPGLGELPILKYFFSSNDKVRQEDEIVFLLIPHIVRESVLTYENTRPIYTGTANSVELIRRDPSEVLAAMAAAQNARSAAQAAASNTSSANAASAMMGQLAAQAHPLSPGAVAPSAAATAAAQIAATPGAIAPPVSLTVVPAVANQTVGSTFQVALLAANAKDLYSVPVQLQFDPKVLQLVNVDLGDLLGRDGQAAALVHRDEGNGAVTISASRPPGVRGVDGQGSIATMTFRAIGKGDATISLVRIGAKNSAGANVPTVGTQGLVHVR
ncbi:MAG: cohesin domain-containing protein [Acidobacteriaceae bacterium]|nr:cohesin domain-containing protein [Acidobacteriaceae bacterium]